jgi:beta-carotene/zeaxanthin 4-ketolase
MILDHDVIFSKNLMVATTILGLWFVTLKILLTVEISSINLGILFMGIALQTFLNTGLFITAHEAMHRLVCPQNSRLNRCFGILALWLYGFFSYDQLLRKHWLHHRYPATDRDPDFHNGQNPSFLGWYEHFLRGYWNWQRFILLLIIIICLSYICQICPVNVVLFWALPLILSSLQLFYFGTFLPHRQPLEGYNNFHRANSTKLPIFLSFLSCYHFGFHQEHHEFPHIPWWQLPTVNKCVTPIQKKRENNNN